MNVPDAINGIYEALGGLLVWINVRAVYLDKGYSGIRLSVMLFFTTWSWWNLYYYPHLHQWMSFIGGINIGIANLAFVIMMIRYGLDTERSNEKS